MKKYTTLLFAIYCMTCSNAFADDTVHISDISHVAVITLLGSLHHNANRGGFTFTLKNQPDEPDGGIDVFIVRGHREKYINRLLSVLLFAKSMNKRVQVRYKVLYRNEKTGYSEGDVVVITVE